MAEICTKCKEILFIHHYEEDRGKVIKVCKNPNCTMKDYPVAFSER